MRKARQVEDTEIRSGHSNFGGQHFAQEHSCSHGQ